jgi:hypothetical protein
VSSIRSRIAVGIATAAVAIVPSGVYAPAAGAAVGQIVGPQNTGPPRLSVARNLNNRYTIRVSGIVRMTQAEAQSLIASNHQIAWRLWEEDFSDDDFVFGPDPASVNATPRGIEFNGLRVVLGSTLDHDPEGGNEELYAGIRLVRGHYRTGPTVRSAETNRVHFDFE